MAKNFKKAEEVTSHVANISPEAMKVILAKIKATTNPGDIRGLGAFVRGPSSFSQSKDFAKFSRPGEIEPIISIKGGGFKITADIVKDISSGKMGQ